MKVSDLKAGDYVLRVRSHWGTVTKTIDQIANVTKQGNIRTSTGYYDSRGYGKGNTVGCIEPLTVSIYRDAVRESLIDDLANKLLCSTSQAREFLTCEDKVKALRIVSEELIKDSYGGYITQSIDILKALSSREDSELLTEKDFTGGIRI